MRKAIVILLLAMAFTVLANAAAPVAPAEAEDSSTAQVAEQPQANFDFSLWLEQQGEAAMCTYEPADEFPFAQERKPGGAYCGGVTCGLFQYCCNPSCGICVFYGMSCTQESCI